MSLADKLQLKTRELAVFGRPDDVDLGDVETTEDANHAVLLFVEDSTDLDRNAAVAVDAAREDLVAWIAYPKGGQLGTDLKRDSLVEALDGKGIRPVRQVAIDDVWSAVRFRPEKG